MSIKIISTKHNSVEFSIKKNIYVGRFNFHYWYESTRIIRLSDTISNSKKKRKKKNRNNIWFLFRGWC